MMSFFFVIIIILHSLDWRLMDDSKCGFNRLQLRFFAVERWEVIVQGVPHQV
jgi:hypothetical protein